MKIAASSNTIVEQSKTCSLIETTFITLATIGVILSNFKISLVAFSIEYIESSSAKYIEEKITMSKNICETLACVETATNILSSMDLSIDPCKNFYKFVCGNFNKNTIIQDDEFKVDTFTTIDTRLQEKLRISIENKLEENVPKAFYLLQSYYKTCMNTSQIEKTSYNEFKEILKKLGDWPILVGESWNESNFDWRKSILQLRNIGLPYYYFLNIFIEMDAKNNTRRIISLDQPTPGIPHEYLSKGSDDKVVQAYFKYMIDFVEIFGINRNRAKEELKESLQFEIELIKISWSKEERNNLNKMYNIMSLREVETKFPGIGWLEFINRFLEPHASVDLDEQINVVVPSFFENFKKLIKKTPKRVLGNYLIWRVAKDLASTLGERIQDITQEMTAAMTGTKQRIARWRECLTEVSESLYLAASALYIRQHFDQSSKVNALDILERLRQSFTGILKQVTWMDEKTKALALKKLELIVLHVAYPDEFLDNNKVDEFHKFIRIYPESFMKSQLSLNYFQYTNMLLQFRKPVNKTDWISHGRSTIVNAFYDATENSIQIPAGILQGRFFAENRPKYLNYGAIGYVIGHEMTHGFDNEGRQFDMDGNLIEWWDPETKKKYLEKTQCIIDQYSNYTVEDVGLNINGLITVSENIADNGGIKEAYFAYKEWEKQNGPEPRLPGLNYTSQQMFWINSANVWCNKCRIEAMQSRIITDEHSPGEFRIIGPFSNMPEFSEDFNCPINSVMNPSKKCVSW